MKTYYFCGWYEPQEQMNKRDERCVCQQHCGNYMRIGCAILCDEKNEVHDEEAVV